MTHEEFLEKKPEIQAALEKAIFDTLSAMPLEDIKKLDWFTYNKPIPTVVVE